jgi:hypothetical protein
MNSSSVRSLLCKKLRKRNFPNDTYWQLAVRGVQVSGRICTRRNRGGSNTVLSVNWRYRRCRLLHLQLIMYVILIRDLREKPIPFHAFAAGAMISLTWISEMSSSEQKHTWFNGTYVSGRFRMKEYMLPVVNAWRKGIGSFISDRLLRPNLYARERTETDLIKRLKYSILIGIFLRDLRVEN